MKLVQVRKCDGACCVEGPRFPNKDGSDCIYRDSSLPGRGCTLQDGSKKMPEGNCPVLPDMSAAEAFRETCLDWPANSDPKIGETAGCCWQWMNDGS
jgi:hypothetical protein